MRAHVQSIVGFVLGVLAATGLSTSVVAQPYPAPLQQALANLTSGVTPFTYVGLTASGYMNWGSGRGATGYGLRDNAGVIQFKHSGGSWANVLAAVTGGTCTNQAVTAISTAGVPTCTTLSSAYVTGTTGTGNFVLAASPRLTGTATIETTVTAAAGAGDLVFLNDTGELRAVNNAGTTTISLFRLTTSDALATGAITPASSGTRFVCISTAGVLTSSASACSGT